MKEKLLTSLDTPAFTINNRVVMAPMNRRRAINGIPSPSTPIYYGQRASAGLIITDNTAVAPNGIGYLHTPGIYNATQKASWKRVVDEMHNRNGRIFMQLVHFGRIGHPLNHEGGNPPTTAVNQLWQTDFTYFKIKHWGWYYLATVMDDYSRYILAWQLCSTMQATDAESTLQQAMQVAGLAQGQRPKVLTDNGSAFVSKHLREYFDKEEIQHVKCAPFHPMTQGKIERYHRSMKNLLLLEHYYLPQELETRITEWVNHYNHHRYHESLDNLTPADVFHGRKEEKLLERKKVKQQTNIKRRTDYIYQKLLTS